MAKSFYRHALAVGIVLLTASAVVAQGSISGVVTKSDLTSPAEGDLVFFGFVDGTDDEIHLSGSIGVDYDQGHWYDDFQNFMTHAPNVPYCYCFFDTIAGEGTSLVGTMPTESYTIQDLMLAPATWPYPPSNVTARRTGSDVVTIAWDSTEFTTWRVYRRAGTSQGSLYRIDNPTGNIGQGLTVPRFVDTNPCDDDSCSYLVIARYNDGRYSPPSKLTWVRMTSCCVGRVGDANGTGGDEPTIGDINAMIDHLYIYLNPLPCLSEADANQSGGLDPVEEDITILDIMVIVDHMFITERELPFCLE